MKVDIFDKNLKKWMAGIVEEVNRQSQKFMYLTVSKEGMSKEFNQKVRWINPEEVDYCGQKLTERKCDKNSSKPETHSKFEAKICFTPKKECPNNYLVDNGFPMALHGTMEYGWGRDMSGMARTRYSTDSSLYDSLILFPPDKVSYFFN